MQPILYIFKALSITTNASEDVNCVMNIQERKTSIKYEISTYLEPLPRVCVVVVVVYCPHSFSSRASVVCPKCPVWCGKSQTVCVDNSSASKMENIL